MSVLPSIMSGPALTSLTAIPTTAEGIGTPQIIIHRHHSTHRLISRHCPEDSGVPLLYTPQTSPLGATKCITQRDYQIRHFLIVLAFCQSKEYAVIRFHRHGVLSPVSLQYQQTDFNLLGRANVCGPGYSFAFWLNL